MKNIRFNKYIGIVLLVIIIINSVLPSFSYAAEGTVWSGILGFLDWSLGILLIPFKILALVPALLVQLVFSLFVSGGEGELVWVTVDKILFNGLDILNVDIFTNPTGVSSDLVLNIRQQTYNWYYTFRNFIIVIYLCSLIYIGIRMAISSIAEDKAKYKRILVNWFIGLCLVIILHNLIIIILKVNNFLVSTIQPKDITGDYNNLMNSLLAQCFLQKFTTSMGSILMYTILAIISFIYFIIYLKRMITVNFLIAIAPLITLTYPIDKVGDNKSQILNSWFKEFISDVLIQFFHCLIYVVFVNVSIQNMVTSGSMNFAAMFVSIVFMCCMFYVEDITKKLFGLDQGGATFLQNLAMGSILMKTYKNVKTVNSLRQNAKDNEQSSTSQIPDQMPDGQTITQALQHARESDTQENVSENMAKDIGKSTEKKAQYQQQSNSFGKQKEKGKLPARVLGGVAKGYVGALDKMAQYTVPFYRAAKKRNKGNYKMDLKEVSKLFQFAASNYIENKNPNMTQDEIQRTLQAINSTDIKNFDPRTPEHNMKLWMLHMQKNFKDEKILNPQEQLNNSIISFSKEYSKQKKRAGEKNGTKRKKGSK